mgnify:CR=1 FL=1
MKAAVLTGFDTPLVTRDDIEIAPPGPGEVRVKIVASGVCHSDLHTARGEWAGTRYPCVPGHEIIGRVTKVGSGVTNFKPGDQALWRAASSLSGTVKAICSAAK